MAIRKIIELGDEKLRKTCKPVEKFDLRLRVLLKDMALWTALKSVVRNSWYVFAWYAAAVAAAAGLYCRRMSKIQN